jgi:MFS family permease
VANFLFFCGIAMFHILARHLRALGADAGLIGAIMGCFGVAAVVAMPLTGSLTDRWGRRPFVFAGYSLTAIAALGWLLFPRLSPVLGVLRLLQGLGFAWALVGAATMAVDLAPPGRLARAIGLFGMGGLITLALGPTLAEALSAAWGFQAVFAAAGGVGFCAVLMLVWVPETHKAAKPTASTSILSLAFRRGTRGPLLAALLSATATGSVIIFLADYAPQVGVPHVSPFFLSYTAAALAARLWASGASDHMGRLRIAVPAYLLSAVSVSMLAGLGATWHSMLIAVGIGASHGLSYPALAALVIERVGEPLRGKAMALYNLSFNVGLMVASFGYGFLARAIGYPPMYLCAGFAALIGCAVLALDRLPERATTP